jgi:tetratricopeptide (TPR) repeat protein
VIAAHNLDAYRAAPDDPDAGEIRASALGWLRRAGERAAALAATDDAQRAFDAAAELADDPLERARLLERAGGLALAGNRREAAEERLRAAYGLHTEAGATHDAARVAAALGVPIWNLGRIEEALELMENAFAVLASDEPDADVAMLTAQLARLHYFAGNLDAARERIELALETAETLDLPRVLAGALNTKSLVLQDRPHESHALLREALAIALEHDLVFDALRAYNNLIVRMALDDRREETGRLLEEALQLARRRGDRFWEVRFAWGRIEELYNVGAWDALLTEADALGAEQSADITMLNSYCILARVCYDRGEDDRARAWLSLMPPELDTESSDVQVRGVSLRKRRLLAMAGGQLDEALRLIPDEIERSILAKAIDSAVEALADAAEAARRLGDPGAAVPIAELFSAWPHSSRTRLLDAELARIRANAAAARGDEAEAADGFALALANARNVGESIWLAPILFDYGSWLAQSGRQDDAEPLLAEARQLFTDLKAVRWLALMEESQHALTPA